MKRESEAGRILRRAARLMERDPEMTYTCWAVAQVLGIWKLPQRFGPCVEQALFATDAGRAYANLLGRLPTTRHYSFAQLPTEDYEERNRLMRDHRILALCMAATLADEGVDLSRESDD